MIKKIFKRAKNYIFNHKLAKKYKKIAFKLKGNIDKEFVGVNDNNSNKIFVCWFQGIENAPELVKMCYKSLLKYNSDKEIIVITEDNFDDYVTFPQFILDKYRKGYISKTHLSDLLRLELLIKYGGIWVDSTIYFTGAIPDYISNSGLFLFQNFNEHSGETVGVSSWFISSCAGNKLLVLERELLYYYWSKNNMLRDYYLFHTLFNRVVIDIYSEEWKNVIISDNLSPKVLDCYLFKAYDEELFKIFSNNHFAHKLMYKYSQEDFEKQGTFYKHLLEIGE